MTNYTCKLRQFEFGLAIKRYIARSTYVVLSVPRPLPGAVCVPVLEMPGAVSVEVLEPWAKPGRALALLRAEHGRTIAFVNTKAGAAALAAQLAAGLAGTCVETAHGGLRREERVAALARFAAGDFSQLGKRVW